MSLPVVLSCNLPQSLVEAPGSEMGGHTYRHIIPAVYLFGHFEEMLHTAPNVDSC